MIEAPDLRQAIRLQQKSYKLLRWLGNAVDKGVVRVDRAHDALDAVGAARYWIQVSLPELPPSTRPKDDELDALANIFASYLTTSFELDEKPGTRLVGRCVMCSYVARAPHLKTRKLSSRDKRKAQELKADIVKELAAGRGRVLSNSEAIALVGDPSLREDIAYVAYATHLIRRMRGGPGQPALLALWREIAWDPRRGPRKDFEVDPDRVLEAQQRIVASVGDA